MAEVSGAWLHVGNLFPSRDILALWIAEEAFDSDALWKYLLCDAYKKVTNQWSDAVQQILQSHDKNDQYDCEMPAKVTVMH